MKYWVADFETLTPKNKEDLKENFNFTEVWGAGICEVGGDNVRIFGSICEFMDFCSKIKDRKPIIYFHNLKFDGSFILDYLMRICGFKHTANSWKLKSKEFSTSISYMGQWYVVRVLYKKKVIEFRDSLKILPFKAEVVAKQLDTKAQKLTGTIDYAKERRSNWINKSGKKIKSYELDEAETKYLKNDILIFAEALKLLEPYGVLNFLTIGSLCMHDFKERMGERFTQFFPNIPDEIDEKLRQSYHGGWCYCMHPGIEHIGVDGFTYDVNSLYPWAMHSNEEHYFPVGKPKHFNGKDFEIFEKALYIINVDISIKLKPGKLPFIQLEKFGEYVKETEDIVNIWITKPDFELLNECYYLEYLNINEGFWFCRNKGIFDEYINYWYDIKKNAKNKVERQIAKLMLNNLYGKFGTSPKGGSYIPILEDENDKFILKTELEHRKSVYIPAAAFITAYARGKTIRAAIENIESFEYADTDSLHCVSEAENLNIGGELGEWKIENSWDMSKFVRKKTYIEHTIKEDGKEIEPYWLIKAAGAPEEVKQRLLYNVEPFEEINEKTELRSNEDFLNRFKIGLVESGKLLSKRIKGGTVLVNTTFEIRY